MKNYIIDERRQREIELINSNLTKQQQLLCIERLAEVAQNVIDDYQRRLERTEKIIDVLLERL